MLSHREERPFVAAAGPDGRGGHSLPPVERNGTDLFSRRHSADDVLGLEQPESESPVSPRSSSLCPLAQPHPAAPTHPAPAPYRLLLPGPGLPGGQADPRWDEGERVFRAISRLGEAGCGGVRLERGAGGRITLDTQSLAAGAGPGQQNVVPFSSACVHDPEASRQGEGS